EQIENQRDEIISQKEEITGSITYASRIQTAMLPGRQLFSEYFKDHFILFKPRDIVSGDFYWVAGNSDIVYFAAADCTGHGVPGAFMSMLGISLLNEISGDGKNDLKPSEILNMLRSKVVTSLSHTGKGSKAIDGLDIAFCRYDIKNRLLSYAGAFNPLYHFRNGKLTVFKADRMPVGYHMTGTGSFNDEQIKIQPGDIIYIFSDGFVDQFGGQDDKKFGSRRFKALLSEVIDLPMDKQHDTLENRFMLWKGNRRQIDDVILMGIKF
ncbi:MAG: SpoIIE family protein phosphatase, partial [Bacteroidales bacterium]